MTRAVEQASGQLKQERIVSGRALTGKDRSSKSLGNVDFRPKSAGPRVLEKHVQEGVTALLELDGWRSLKMDPVSRREWGKGFGEIGMPDHLYIRYLGPEWPEEEEKKRWAEVLWIEFKAPGKTPKPHQLDWHSFEQKRGALVMVVDNFDEFRRWYVASPLNNRIAI